MTPKDLIFPAFAQMLEALSGQLDKARETFDGEGKSFETLMASRLAPDMFPLASQVQFVCIQSEEAIGRLFDRDIAAVEAPQSFDAAKALISQTIDRLCAAHESKTQVDTARDIALELQNGMTFDLDAPEYVRSWLIPQFYFHLITAYAIMRSHGVGLGKPDYVPHMFRFLRQD